jgi:T5SS/PEP-CTERM-associated repeat protein
MSKITILSAAQLPVSTTTNSCRCVGFWFPADDIKRDGKRRIGRAMWPVALVGLVLSAVAPGPAAAIDIEFEYTTDFGGDESPAWDSSGAILTSHFNAAVAIWERLLPGPGSYEFDFQWDDDIDDPDDDDLTLGLTTDRDPIDLFIEINPNVPWYIDSTPDDNHEFELKQTLFSQPDHSPYFLNATPPSALEVGYCGKGIPIFKNGIGQPDVNAATGVDLLSTVIHEIGHALGIDSEGLLTLFNIYPHHLAGGEVYLLGDGSHLPGRGEVPFLMCKSCAEEGVRSLPSATDILALAQDQGITDVHLDRVGSILGGYWSESNRWVGGDVPDITQDVYIRHGGVVALNADGLAKNLLVSNGNQLKVQSFRLTADATLNFDGATVSVASGGTVAANTIHSGTGTLVTDAGSTIRFNDFTTGGSSTFSFGGNVAIGYDTRPAVPALVTFRPALSSTWNIAGQLSVGDERTITALVINRGTTFTSASGRIGTDFHGGGEGHVDISDSGSSWTVNGNFDGRNGTFDVENGGVFQTGPVSLGDDNGKMLAYVSGPRSGTGPRSTWIVNGNVDVGPSTDVGSGEGRLTVRDNGLMTVSGDVTVHGTSTVMSKVVVDTGGDLLVAGDVTTTNPFGSVQILGSTLRASRLLPFPGTFIWTNGTLELTGQHVLLDALSPALPLPATTTLQNNQTLIVSGTGRNLIVGQSAAGEFVLANSASVEVHNGDVLIAEKPGSTGAVRLAHTNTKMFVGGSMEIGGNQAGLGGVAQLDVAGDVTVANKLTFRPGASVRVDANGALSADVLRHGGGALVVNAEGLVRFNTLEGFGAHIVIGGVSAVGIAEGRTGRGALVRNTGEEFSFRYGWIIGDNAQANVDLINGGFARDDGFVHLGNRQGSAGTVLNVSGVDPTGKRSALLVLNESDESLVVGDEDVATMNVNNQGHVRSGSAIIARDITASGSQAVVHGPNSLWEVFGNTGLVVGGGAEGRLAIENQGKVEIDNTLFIGGAPRHDEEPDDFDPSIPSVVRITGAGSTGHAREHNRVGYDFAGQLILELGGKMFTDQNASIANEPLAAGSLADVSTGAMWRIGQQLEVGNAASGKLQIRTGGEVESASAAIARLPASAGSIAIVDGTGSQWRSTGSMVVGDGADGRLLITNGGTVANAGGTVGNGLGATGSVYVDGTDSKWTSSSTLFVGRAGEGELHISDGGEVSNTFSFLGRLADATGTARVDGAGSRWTNSGILWVGANGTGELEITAGGTVSVGLDAYIGQALSASGELIIDGPGSKLDVAGSLKVGDQGLGLATVQNGGVISAPGGLSVNPVSVLGGNGTIFANVTNDGVVAPGEAVGLNPQPLPPRQGTLHINGNYSQTTNGFLQIELASPTNFDNLDVAGNVNLAVGASGVLQVSLADGFIPHGRQSFDILDWTGSLTGTFTSLQIPTLGTRLTWDTSQLYTTGVLSVIGPTLAGDYNNNGNVDAADYIVWRRSFGQAGAGLPADGDGNGIVDQDDFGVWRANFGAVYTVGSENAAALVPEPYSVWLMLTCVGRLLARSRQPLKELERQHS